MERLGKVIWLSEDGKRGIFLSVTRGLVEYDSIGNQFSEVSSDAPWLSGRGLFVPPAVHTVFDDSYLLLCFMGSIGFPAILAEMFPSEAGRQRFLCHSLHSILKEGARISCDLFVQKNVLSYLADYVPHASLRTDTAFFTAMGDDNVKLRFFKSFIKLMRQRHPGFGRGAMWTPHRCRTTSRTTRSTPSAAMAWATLPCRRAWC